MNKLLETYPEEIARILAKYPAEQKRSAVMPLLYLAQRKLGYVTRQSINEIAEIAGVSPTEVASMVGFYTLYHDDNAAPLPPAGLHRPALRPARRGRIPGEAVPEPGPEGGRDLRRMACSRSKKSPAWQAATALRCSRCRGMARSPTTRTRRSRAQVGLWMICDRSANGGSGSGKTSSTV